MFLSFLSVTTAPALLRIWFPGSLIIVSVFLLMCSLVVSTETLAADEGESLRQVSLEGILGSKAVLSIDGKRKLLA
ncbi:MAG: hypothetical protein KAU29_04030, partial [Gammaproteobacteria bacterium]|nr:hypothetical protein [Gammaproteobacteria bacterium]